MSMRNEITALARCGLKSAQATDGRAVHGALIECRNALVRFGSTETMAMMSALAMVRVGQAISEASKGAH